MQAYPRYLHQQLGSNITWAQVPTLEALYGEMASFGDAAVEESERHCRTYFDAIVNASDAAGCKVLAIELSILDRSSSLDDSMTFRSCFYQLDDMAVSLVTARTSDAESESVIIPPYQAAMNFMMKFNPAGSSIAEPIVHHPGLRDQELLYIVSDPRRVGCVNVPATDSYKLVPLPPTLPTLITEAQARSKVYDQVLAFHARLLDEIDSFTSHHDPINRQKKHAQLFDHATLLVVPFIRDIYDRAARKIVAGEADRDIMEREGASGLVAFIWLVRKQFVAEPDVVDQIASRVLELHRVMLVKDGIRKSTLLAQKSQFVQDAAHGIANQIAMLQLKAVTELFYGGRRKDAPRIATYRMVDGRPDPGDENIKIIEQYDESVDFINNLVSNYLAVIELGTGPGFVRKKFQADSAYSIEDAVREALSSANRWRREDHPLAEMTIVYSYRIGEDRCTYEADCKHAVILPIGYLRSGILQSQFIEAIMNARKHGARNGSGVVQILLEIGFDTTRDRPLVVSLSNAAAARLSRSSPKVSPLNFVPGLKVGSEVLERADADHYCVTYEFGSVFYEAKQTGVKAKAAPIVQRSGA